jgi:single-strand DNA-binding protein
MAWQSNHVTLIGANLTRDAEVKYLTNGMAQTKFGVAYNYSFKRKNSEDWEQETSYFNVIVWGKEGERLAPRLRKGKKVAVEGRLRSFKYEKDGRDVNGTEIVSDLVVVYTPERDDAHGQAQEPDGNRAEPAGPDTGYAPAPW